MPWLIPRRSAERDDVVEIGVQRGFAAARPSDRPHARVVQLQHDLLGERGVHEVAAGRRVAWFGDFPASGPRLWV